MKFLKGLAITLVVVFVLIFVGAFIFLKSFDVNKYRPQIAAEVSKQLGRQVKINNMGLNLSLFNGVYAQVVGLSVSEDPAFGVNDFASLGAVKLNVDVMAYLTRREIVVSKVIIEDLKLTIIKDAAGIMNVQKIGPPAGELTASSKSSDNSGAKQSSAPAAVIPNFSVKTITIANAHLLYIDKGQNPPMQIPASKMDIIVKDFSLNTPFGFEGKVAVLGQNQNLSFSGQASVNAQTQEVQLSQVEVNFDLAKLAIADLLTAVPALASAGLKEDWQGKISVAIPTLSAGAKGLGVLNAKGSLQGGRILTSMLPVAVEKISADFVADAKDIDVASFSLQLSSGMVTGKAKIMDYQASQGLSLQAKTIVVPLAALVAGLPEGMTLGGGINAEITLSGQNLSNPDKFLSSLNGSGQFDVKNGKIENFNLLKTILSRIDFIPGLASSIEMNIPEKYRKDYLGNETVFQNISSSLSISNGTVNLPDMQVLSDLFEANMQITADPKLNGTVAGQVKLPTDLSEYLATEAKPLSYLKNSTGQIVIPFTSFTGPLASFKPMPDVKSLGKAAIENEGRNQLNKLLNKALKTSDEPVAGDDQQAPAPEKEIINNVLDKIFK